MLTSLLSFQDTSDEPISSPDASRQSSSNTVTQRKASQTDAPPPPPPPKQLQDAEDQVAILQAKEAVSGTHIDRSPLTTLHFTA